MGHILTFSSYLDNDLTRRKFEQADCTLFSAILCSDTSYEKLCTVAKYMSWYFIWDDCECPFFPFMMDYAEEYDFRTVTESLAVEEICQILLEQMLGYVSSVSNVDSLFSSSAMPSVRSYWQRRERTAAVYCVICTFPLLTKQSTSFAYGFNITRAHVENEHMSRMWKHTSYLAHISNDIHSFQKEYNDGQLENLIPVLMANTGLDVNQTMQLSYHICRLEVEGFCANADRLCVGEDAQGRRIREVFINCCTDMFMGLIHWRYYRPLTKHRVMADLYLVMLASAGSSKRISILIKLLHSRLDLQEFLD
ncbi:terpenoid synthase [Aspergillus eucalypticola CBS 122712]|uniref:Terpenoid synthase n=1 Tax=Aspergillus eucalypticola (strain CBS 122712 / IBT 29274) TaxID=1448314 RepID=A0A317V836_ASPEC|nr:terpenoid synthase [Aspergillus eucalypticola CBS 122712]PWY68230.1 terpenoid synthase [Aspergillus eucalypticola CBS 122712]